jgi:aspartyl protease family protein
MRLALAACAWAVCWAWAPALAQSVALQGMLGERALLVVDGVPKAVAAGETFRGVRLLSAQGGEAVVESGGKRHMLRLGETPGRLGGEPGASAALAGTSASSGRIVLQASSGGHFLAPGQVNGKPAMFMVDTGASTISMGASDAERFGLDYKAGQPVQLRTANGVTLAWRVKLATVRIGDVDLSDQDAVVGERPMPYVLLGNTVLNRFTMRRDHEQMVLERR